MGSVRARGRSIFSPQSRCSYSQKLAGCHSPCYSPEPEDRTWPWALPLLFAFLSVMLSPRAASHTFQPLQSPYYFSLEKGSSIVSDFLLESSLSYHSVSMQSREQVFGGTEWAFPGPLQKNHLCNWSVTHKVPVLGPPVSMNLTP